MQCGKINTADNLPNLFKNIFDHLFRLVVRQSVLDATQGEPLSMSE